MPIPSFSITENVGASLLGLSNQMAEKIDKLVTSTAGALAAEMKRSFATAKHGEVYSTYSISGKSRPHTASALGEAPAINTGFLTNSIIIRPGSHRYERRVVVGAEYGLYLEMGTIHIKPRPFMGPALNKVAPGFHNGLKMIILTKGIA